MSKNDLNVTLKGIDELLFSTEEQRQEEKREQVQQIPIDELHPFTNHPFKVLDDDSMKQAVESIKQYGVLSPLIARPRPDGDGYEIISGHRRQFAARQAGLETLPVLVREMEDDAATILMIDSNLQREHILPSERAFAYKMKLDGGQIDAPELTIQEVREEILEAHHMEKGRRIAKDYDVIMDKAAEAEELGLNNRHSTLEKLAALASAKEKCDAPECNPAGCRKVMAAYEL